MNKTFVRCSVVVLDGDQLLSCSGEIATVGRDGGEHHACVEPKAVVSGLVGKRQQRARTRFGGIEPGEVEVLPHCAYSIEGIRLSRSSCASRIFVSMASASS